MILGSRGMRELDEGSEKAHTSSYKIDRHWDAMGNVTTIVNTAARHVWKLLKEYILK